jgi:tetratricopeptide (TPR) repeat protein
LLETQTKSTWQSLARSPAGTIALLTLVAIVFFAGVTRLMNRFHEQEKALARHMYAQGLSDQQSGSLDRAVEDFRAALSYDHNNFDYQLSLARALRDSGRVDEAEAYLITLWEQQPQDGFVNLALARLEVRKDSVQDALRYYHSAIYGVWPSDSDMHRSQAQLELINFLLDHKALAQAQAELISLSSSLTTDAAAHVRAADLFLRAHDPAHALAEYQAALRHDPNLVAAAAGAGEAAFALGRYRTAETYLERAARKNPDDAHVAELLQTATLIRDSDPYEQGITQRERRSRLQSAWTHAGERLQTCAQSQPLTNPSNADFAALHARWLELKPQIDHLPPMSEEDVSDQAMDVIASIEQETAKTCGSASGSDQALLIISQNRMAQNTSGADQ